MQISQFISPFVLFALSLCFFSAHAGDTREVTITVDGKTHTFNWDKKYQTCLKSGKKISTNGFKNDHILFSAEQIDKNNWLLELREFSKDKTKIIKYRAEQHKVLFEANHIKGTAQMRSFYPDSEKTTDISFDIEC